jgi:hypothetical protein
MKANCISTLVFALVALFQPLVVVTEATSTDLPWKETEQAHLRRTSGTSAEQEEAFILLTPRDLAVKVLNIVGDDGNPASAFPLGQCQGDCDTDDDCLGSLKCFQRQKGDDIRKVPGCKANNITKLSNGGTDFCYNPNDVSVSPTTVRSPVRPPVQTPAQETLDFVGEDWNPRSEYPLQLCEGDCDGDFDCAGELVCHERDKNAPDPVPGCAGQDTTTRDYCVRPSDDLAQSPVSGAFRLKQFWRYGYKWQDEFWEQEWCMECAGGSSICEVNDSIIISHCSNEKSTWFLYKNLKDEVTQIQIATTNLCFEWVHNKDIFVKTCDGSNERQKFKALNGTFEGMKFELSTASEEGCLSQQHHPKDEELIYRMPCALTRKHTTSFWTHY